MPDKNGRPCNNPDQMPKKEISFKQFTNASTNDLYFSFVFSTPGSDILKCARGVDPLNVNDCPGSDSLCYTVTYADDGKTQYGCTSDKVPYTVLS